VLFVLGLSIEFWGGAVGASSLLVGLSTKEKISSIFPSSAKASGVSLTSIFSMVTSRVASSIEGGVAVS
jgi:hypothetical protein